MPDTGARPRKAKPPPEPTPDPREHLEDWRDKKNLSGSDAAEFSFVLAHQVRGALAYGAAPDPVMKGTQQLAAFAALAGTRPADPLEGMLAAQMVAVHDAAMSCLRRANVPGQTFEARRG